MMKWALLGGAIVAEITATMTLKAALDHSGLYAIIVPGFVGSFFFLAATLRRGMPIGVAYGIWSAVGVAGTSILSSVFYSESFTTLQAIGVALIFVGVLTVKLGSHRATMGLEISGTS